MRKFTLLLVIFFLSFNWQTEAQVTIGTGTVTGQGLPIEPYYGYSYSQVIYLQSEIGAAMDIGEIIYAMTPTGSITNSQDWVIYMGHTAKTEFDSTSDWVDVSAMTQVFSGTVSTNSGVVSIILDTPFSYNGTDNLVIAVDENTSGYDTGSDDFYATSTPSANRGILFRSDSTNPDPTSPPTASYLREYLANISLAPAPSCSIPTDIEVVPTGTNAGVTWSDTNDPPPENWEYELVNVTAGGAATGTPTGTFASSPGSLSSLVQGADYQILMRSVCVAGSDYSAWSSPVSWHQPLPGDTCTDPLIAVVNTDCNDAAAVKYNLDFTLAQNQGTVSCSNGNEVYGYWFSITITTPISLRINNAETDTNVGMLVGVDCTMTPELTCEMLGTAVNVTDINPGTYYALFWSETQSGTTELCFESVSCMAPQDIESDYIGNDSANLHWNAPSSATEVEWEVTETGQSTVIDSGTTTNSYTEVVNLAYYTDYTFKIRSNCGGGVYSDWNTYDFRTTLENDLPEDAITLNIDLGTSCGPNAITGISNENSIDSGINAPQCGSYGTPTSPGDLWYVFTAPYETVTLNVENVSVLTSVAAAYYSGLPDSLTEEGCTEFSSNWPWEITGLTAGNVYYLRVWDYNNDQIGTFDLCGYYESCPAPSDLTIDSFTNSEVTFSWQDNAGVGTWYYDVRPAGDPAPSGTDMGNPTTNNPTTDSGLSSETSYDVYVRADCGSGDYSLWTGPATFTTLSDEAADWNNLQWPPYGTIEVGTAYVVYAQIYEPGLTDADANAPGAGISAWIGYNNADTDPATWTNWIPATYNLDSGNNDEFMADIGSGLAPGNYFYASRFKINNGVYTYGGIGGFWNNDSGTLTVNIMENDACEGAVPVTNLPYNISQDATYATNNNGYIDDICGTNGMNDGVWYTFTVATGGDITVSIDPTGWDPELAIYSGSCGSFTCVDRADSGGIGSSESITFTADAGVTYYVNIGYWSDSTDGAEGPFDLSITSIGAVLGIAQNIVDGFTMYPNPVLDILHLSADNTINTIVIYNMLGQEVLETSSNSNNTQIDLSTLPSGSYIVKIQAGEQVGSYNLIKQ
jgi:hypothetical protein